MLNFDAVGCWIRGRVSTAWVASTFAPPPEALSAIERAWTGALRDGGRLLFDGPMCRLESVAADRASLRLGISRTGYRNFFGTNLSGPSLGDRFGAGALANPLGVSAALHTADDCLLLGRRNRKVAYHPGRIHPFAGALEPADAQDVFGAVERELGEELGLERRDIQRPVCLGIIQDRALRQPELIFTVHTPRTAGQVEAALDRAEHDAVVALPATLARLGEALGRADAWTPVAVGTVLLWARENLGTAAFAELCAVAGLRAADCPTT